MIDVPLPNHLKDSWHNAMLNQEFIIQCTHPQVFESYRQAVSWARAKLSNHVRIAQYKPESWCICLHASSDGYACSISQPGWSSDYTGDVRSTGALAVVQCVLELTVTL